MAHSVQRRRRLRIQLHRIRARLQLYCLSPHHWFLIHNGGDHQVVSPGRHARKRPAAVRVRPYRRRRTRLAPQPKPWRSPAFFCPQAMPAYLYGDTPAGTVTPPFASAVAVALAQQNIRPTRQRIRRSRLHRNPRNDRESSVPQRRRRSRKPRRLSFRAAPAARCSPSSRPAEAAIVAAIPPPEGISFSASAPPDYKSSPSAQT